MDEDDGRNLQQVGRELGRPTLLAKIVLLAVALGPPAATNAELAEQVRKAESAFGVLDSGALGMSSGPGRR